MTSSDPPPPGDVRPNFDAETLAEMLRAFRSHTGTKNPEGPTPPQPPRPGQNADVTGARPLNLESTPAKNLAVTSTVKPNVFAPRLPTARATHQSDGPMSEDMLSAVSGNSMTTELHTEVATYIPNSQAMYIILDDMDRNMSQTKRWLDNSYGWIPQYSRLYFGVLFIVQNLRAQRDGGNLSFEMINLLDTFERVFSLGNLLIPGPLVPIFKSISSSRIDNDVYGNVCPTLPDKPSMSANGVVLPTPSVDLIKWHVPTVPAIFDEICTLAFLQQGTQDIYAQILRSGNSPGAFGTAFTAASPATDAFNMPGMMSPIPMPTHAVDSFYTCVSSFSFPAPMPNASLRAGINNWFDYCRLSTGNTTHMDWMSKLSSTMSVYAQFFNGTMPLGDIASSSLPTGQIYGNYVADSLPTKEITTTAITVPSAPEARFYRKPSGFTAEAKFFSNSLSIPEIEEWRQMLAQTNCKHNALTDTVPDLYRTGTFWNIPKVRESNAIKPLIGVPNIISRKFHRTSRDDSL
jgi:hypothetical protein